MLDEIPKARESPGRVPAHVVEVRKVTSRKSQYALLLRGYTHDPITDVRVVDCTFDGVEKPDVVEAVKGLTFRNVRRNGQLLDQVR